MTARNERSLGGIRAFAALSPEVRTHIENRCRWRAFEPGAEIIGYQDPSNDVFFIVSGQVRVMIYASSGKAVTFRTMRAGEMFGELTAIDGQRRSASVEASSRCLIAQMTSAAFWDLLTTQPAVTRAVLLHLAGIIRSLSTRIYEVSTLAVQNRIHAELVRLAREGDQSGESVLIARAPTHSDIASRISTHREAVTRELGRLARLGLIERRGRGLLIHDIQRLIRMVSDASKE